MTCVLSAGDEVDYVVVRCSDGAITNLHLNNKARLFEELSLAPSVREELFCRSITAMKALGLRYAGIDVLIARNTDTPYIIEVNGQETISIRICLRKIRYMPIR